MPEETQVIAKLLDRNVRTLFPSARAAANALGISESHLCHLRKGRYSCPLKHLENSIPKERAALPAFLRYAGSKRRFLRLLLNFIPEDGDLTGRFIEPFAGSAALFLAANPPRAWLNDINPELINLFSCLQSNPEAVWEALNLLPVTQEGYYLVRDGIMEADARIAAARTLYLNRTCFGGMWRYNRGKFTTGYGGHERLKPVTLEGLQLIGKRLQGARLTHWDMRKVIAQAKQGDFLFLDPPYTPGNVSVSAGFMAFSLDDHKDLANLLQSTKATWVLTTSNHKEVRQLFDDWAHILEMPRGVARGRVGATQTCGGELLILSKPLLSAQLAA